MTQRPKNAEECILQVKPKANADKKNIDEKAKKRIIRDMGRKEREQTIPLGIGNKRAEIKSITSIFCQLEQFGHPHLLNYQRVRNEDDEYVI